MDPYKAFGARPPPDSPQASGSPSLPHGGQYMDMHQGFGGSMGSMPHRFDADFASGHIPAAHMGRSHHPYFGGQQHPYMDYYQMQHQMARADIQRPVPRAMEAAHMGRAGYGMDLPPAPSMDRPSIYEQHTGMMRQSLERTGMERMGMDRSGMDRFGSSMDRYGMDRSGVDRLGMDHSGMDRMGMGMDRYGMDRSGMDRLGMGQINHGDMLGMGHQGMGRHGMDSYGMERQGLQNQSMERHSMEQHPAMGAPMDRHTGIEPGQVMNRNMMDNHALDRLAMDPPMDRGAMDRSTMGMERVGMPPDQNVPPDRGMPMDSNGMPVSTQSTMDNHRMDQHTSDSMSTQPAQSERSAAIQQDLRNANMGPGTDLSEHRSAMQQGPMTHSNDLPPPGQPPAMQHSNDLQPSTQPGTLPHNNDLQSSSQLPMPHGTDLDLPPSQPPSMNQGDSLPPNPAMTNQPLPPSQHGNLRPGQDLPDQAAMMQPDMQPHNLQSDLQSSMQQQDFTDPPPVEHPRPDEAPPSNPPPESQMMSPQRGSVDSKDSPPQGEPAARSTEGSIGEDVSSKPAEGERGLDSQRKPSVDSHGGDAAGLTPSHPGPEMSPSEPGSQQQPLTPQQAMGQGPSQQCDNQAMDQRREQNMASNNMSDLPHQGMTSAANSAPAGGYPHQGHATGDVGGMQTGMAGAPGMQGHMNHMGANMNMSPQHGMMQHGMGSNMDAMGRMETQMNMHNMPRPGFMASNPNSPMNQTPRSDAAPQAHSSNAMSQASYMGGPTSMGMPRTGMHGVNMSGQPGMSESSPSSSGTGTPPINKPEHAQAMNQRQQTSTLLREHLLRNSNPYGRDLDPQQAAQGGSPLNNRQRMGAHSPEHGSYPSGMPGPRGMPDNRARQSHFGMDDLMKGNRMPGQHPMTRPQYGGYYPGPRGMNPNMPFNHNAREGVNSPPYQMHPGLEHGRYPNNVAGRGAPRHPFSSGGMYPQQGQSSYPGTPQSSSAGSFLSLLTDDEPDANASASANPLMVASQPERLYSDQQQGRPITNSYGSPQYGMKHDAGYMGPRPPYTSPPPHPMMGQSPRHNYPQGPYMNPPRPDYPHYNKAGYPVMNANPQEDPASVLGDLRRLCAPQQPPNMRSPPPAANVNYKPQRPASPRQSGPRQSGPRPKKMTKKQKKMQPKLVLWKLFMHGQTTVDLPEFMEELK